MICNNCKMRWAELPPNYPFEIMTEEEKAERVKRFESDEIKGCPICVDEPIIQVDYFPYWKY